LLYSICAGVAPDLSPHYHHILGGYRARNPLSLVGEPGTEVTSDSCFNPQENGFYDAPEPGPELTSDSFFNPQENVPSEAPVLTHCKRLSILIHTGKGGRGEES